MDVIEFVFFPSDIDPSLGKDVFHGDSIELSEFLVKLTIKEESLSKGVDWSLLIAKWNRDLLLVESSDVVMKWLTAMLSNAVEVA